MATPPVFSVGQYNTAAYMNSIGLWRITGGTFSGTLLSVSNCFTSDFRNYRLVIDNAFTPAGIRTLSLQLQSGGTPAATQAYYWAGYYSTFAGGFGPANSTVNGLTYMITGTSGTYSPTSMSLDIFNPQVSTAKTSFTLSAINYDAGFHVGGYHDVTASYDGFRFGNTLSSTTNCNWALYGLR